ncbi:hypothetical protein ABL78_4740 [Leptomonas seymouri]|uniref:Membrane-associated protein n=1 Tax=Leptomonas seymouri TaxID=5684 RepID=A0A0N0P5N3_LEPSE|nr:hypothetical protein ABL78_4740 [Leptomonas seymouri]|eukprot:KPI86187.1 hypothetical protein ABL78_4740 [Leptomonas seymouri]
MQRGCLMRGCHRQHICWASFLQVLVLCCVVLVPPSRCENPNDNALREAKEGASPAAAFGRPYEVDNGVCPDVSFHFFVSSAMGLASSTRALSTCTTRPYSTIFDDVQLARQARESTDTFSTGLWRLTHGNTEELVFYDNAPEFLSLRAEMGAWVRANSTVGMNPSAYEAVVRGADAVLGLNASLFNAPFVELPPSLASLSGTAQINWTQRFHECRNSSRCIQQVAQDAYRLHANSSLRAAPHMIVSNTTFTRAQKYYETAVFPSTIVRTFNLDPATTSSSFDRNLKELLRSVQQMWDDVVREVAEEAEGTRDEGSGRTSPIPAPYLLFLRETDITGPERPETKRLGFVDPAYPRPSRHSGMRLQALRRILPMAVVYQTSADCTTCDLFNGAFDILPAVYKRMCSRGYRSIVSCSPVTLFIRTTHVRPFQLLPSMELYARLAYSRRAVLRVADLNLRHVQKGDDHSDDYSVEDGVNRQRRGATDEEDDADEDTHGSLFYSLQVKYGKWSTGIEDEVRPRTQFQPYRIPLRLQQNVGTVEEAVVGIIGHLVENGVIQFLFLDPEEVSQIAMENERVKKMLRAQEKQQQQQQDGLNGTRGQTNDEAESKSASSSNASTAFSHSPLSSNPEDHPQYRKVVSFQDLATKLVSAHTRAVFGDLRHVPPHSIHRGDSVGDAIKLSSPSPPWGALSWVFRVPHAAWALLFSGVERPLYVTVFVLLCLYQRWWNRWQRVSYW